jgi:hypothetical protein
MKSKLLLIFCITTFLPAWHIITLARKENIQFFPATDKRIRYAGRIDFSNPDMPRFWAPGVYIEIVFEGPACEMVVNDEVLYGRQYNYLQILVDGKTLTRVQTTGKQNTIKIASGLAKGSHTALICKCTESGVGFLELIGFNCADLKPLPPAPKLKMEFIGNSITCGSGTDQSVKPCGQGEWYDQQNAFNSYGPVAARALKAQWHLTAVSGIGLIKSCCNMTITMPQVYDKINMRENSGLWDPGNYHPDIITVCLGQNDGLQDTILFRQKYMLFIRQLRKVHPSAKIFCISSPMANEELAAYQRKNLGVIIAALHSEGDGKVWSYFFTQRYHKGCGDHPDLQEHQQIADELVKAIQQRSAR